jgi:hypothetical protein
VIPKERRDRLFKSGRPFIRSLQIYDGGNYHKDIGVLWVAHKRRPFYELKPDITQEQFAHEISSIAQKAELLIAEDGNHKHKAVALIAVSSNGWKVEPHAEFFQWATPKNILRVSVAFFQMIRYRQIGSCVVLSLPESKSLFDKCCTYGVLHKVGEIANGDPRGDELVYSVRGKLKCRKQ